MGSLGRGHGHGQELERANLSSVAAPLGPSPEARREYAVLTTMPATPTTTTNNNVFDSMPHIDNTLDTLDILIPDSLISRRPLGHGHDHDQSSGMTEPHSLITDGPYSLSTGSATGGRKLEVKFRVGRMTKPLAQDVGNHTRVVWSKFSWNNGTKQQQTSSHNPFCRRNR